MLCKRGLCRHAVCVCLSDCLSVCLCVCVSVTFVHSVKTNKDNFEIFSPSGRQAILVFLYQTPWQYSDASHPNGGVECRRNKQKSPMSLCLASLPAVNAATGQVLSIRRRPTTVPQVVTLTAGSKRRCWLGEKTTKCLWQKASTLRQRQQNGAFNCTQW